MAAMRPRKSGYEADDESLPQGASANSSAEDYSSLEDITDNQGTRRLSRSSGNEADDESSQQGASANSSAEDSFSHEDITDNQGTRRSSGNEADDESLQKGVSANSSVEEYSSFEDITDNQSERDGEEPFSSASPLPSMISPSVPPPLAALTTVQPSQRGPGNCRQIGAVMLNRCLQSAWDVVRREVLRLATDLSLNLLNAPELRGCWPKRPTPLPELPIWETSTAVLHQELRRILAINDTDSVAFPRALWMPDNVRNILLNTSGSSTTRPGINKNEPTVHWRRAANRMLEECPLDLDDSEDEEENIIKHRCSFETYNCFWPFDNSLTDRILHNRWNVYQYIGLYNWYESERRQYNRNQEDLYYKQVNSMLCNNDVAIKSMAYLMHTLDDFSLDFSYRISPDIYKLRLKRFCQRVDLHFSMIFNMSITLDLALIVCKITNAFLRGAKRLQNIIQRQRDSRMQPRFLCEYCGQDFADIDDIKDHLYMIHDVDD